MIGKASLGDAKEAQRVLFGDRVAQRARSATNVPASGMWPHHRRARAGANEGQRALVAADFCISSFWRSFSRTPSAARSKPGVERAFGNSSSRSSFT